MTSLIPLKQKYLPENGSDDTKDRAWGKRGLRGANHGTGNSGRASTAKRKKRGQPAPYTKMGHN